MTSNTPNALTHKERQIWPEALLLRSAGLYALSFLVFGMLPMYAENFFLAQTSQNVGQLGLAAGYIVFLTIPAALGHIGTLAVVRWWRRRTSGNALDVPWMPILAAALTIGLAYTGLPNLVLAILENLPPSTSDQALLILPVALSVAATGLSLALLAAISRFRNTDQTTQA